MLQCKWFVLCESVIHDSSTNNLSIINAISELHSRSFPALHPRFAFGASLVRKEADPVDLSLRLVRKCETKDEALLTLTKKTTTRNIQFFVNFPAGIRLFAPGPVSFRIEAKEPEGDWTRVCSQTLDVVQAVAQQEAVVLEPETASDVDPPKALVEENNG